MPNAQEVRDLLEYASQLPWAPSRSAQIAQAAMWADALEGETDLMPISNSPCPISREMKSGRLWRLCQPS